MSGKTQVQTDGRCLMKMSDDILGYIFGYLGEYDDVKSLYQINQACLKVCHKVKMCFSYVDNSYFDNKLRWNNMAHVLNSRFQSYHRIEISHCNITESALFDLICVCKNDENGGNRYLIPCDDTETEIINKNMQLASRMETNKNVKMISFRECRWISNKYNILSKITETKCEYLSISRCAKMDKILLFNTWQPYNLKCLLLDQVIYDAERCTAHDTSKINSIKILDNNFLVAINGDKSRLTTINDSNENLTENLAEKERSDKPENTNNNENINNIEYESAFPNLEVLGLTNCNLWEVSLNFLRYMKKLKYLFLGGSELFHPQYSHPAYDEPPKWLIDHLLERRKSLNKHNNSSNQKQCVGSTHNGEMPPTSDEKSNNNKNGENVNFVFEDAKHFVAPELSSDSPTLAELKAKTKNECKDDDDAPEACEDNGRSKLNHGSIGNERKKNKNRGQSKSSFLEQARRRTLLKKGKRDERDNEIESSESENESQSNENDITNLLEQDNVKHFINTIDLFLDIEKNGLILCELTFHPLIFIDTMQTVLKKCFVLNLDVCSPCHRHLPNEYIKDHLVSYIIYKFRKYEQNNWNIDSKNIGLKYEANQTIISQIEFGIQHASNSLSIYQQTPLHLAAISGNETFAHELIKYGHSSIESLDKRGATPLYRATQKSQINVVKLLLNNGANCLKAKRTKETPVELACLRGYYDIVKLFILHQISIGKYDEFDNIDHYDDGWSPIHWACVTKRMNILKLLLKYNFKVNAQNRYKLTPLHVASRQGWIEGVKLLLNYYSTKDLQLKDEYQRTAVHLARISKQYEIAEMIESKFMTSNDKGDAGMNPYAPDFVPMSTNNNNNMERQFEREWGNNSRNRFEYGMYEMNEYEQRYVASNHYLLHGYHIHGLNHSNNDYRRNSNGNDYYNGYDGRYRQAESKYNDGDSSQRHRQSQRPRQWHLQERNEQYYDNDYEANRLHTRKNGSRKNERHFERNRYGENQDIKKGKRRSKFVKSGPRSQAARYDEYYDNYQNDMRPRNGRGSAKQYENENQRGNQRKERFQTNRGKQWKPKK